MYPYNRPKRSFSKEAFSVGPQFTLQASATNVADRQARQKEAIPLRQNDIISATNFARARSSNANQAEPVSMPSTPERTPNGGHVKGSQHRTPPTTMAYDIHGVMTPTHESSPDEGRYFRPSSRHTGPGTPVYLPGDRVIFTESPNAPGIPIIYRTPDEQSANPDRLNLDRRRLAVCPILEGEEQLRLLNYQHNNIRQISQMGALKRLIFLDLYDNQIEQINGLGALRSLRVLMLGKNRITRIENLENLTKLDVLDLHGNQIRKVENLKHLQELRVLNLAGNLIEHVNNLGGMDSLTELNLRRNKIRTVRDVENLRCLQRIFLSFNEITCFEDISSMADCQSITELSLDGNPFQQDPNYKKTVIRNMQQLRQFDMKRISDDEKRTAVVIARKEDDKKRQENKLQLVKERRQLAIHNAKRQWEVMQGGHLVRSTQVLQNTMPELYANHVATYHNGPDEGMEEDEPAEVSRSSSRLSRPQSAKSVMSERESSRTLSRRDSMSSQGVLEPATGVISETASTGSLNHFTDLEGDTLTLYGTGALDAFDRNWGIQAAGTVTTVIFKFIDFDEIVKHLHKIRVRFPNVHTLQFVSTNISSFQQINALSTLRRLDSLSIESEGNPITQFTLWRTYVLFRLAHFSLKKINDIDVSSSDIVNAEKIFGTLSHMTTSQLPQSRLLSLLGDSKRKHLLDDKKKPSSSEGRLTDRGTESVGRAGLVYAQISPSDTCLPTKVQDGKNNKEFVKNYVKELATMAVDSDHKQASLHKLWPQILYEMVRALVFEMWDSQSYARKCLEELEKS